MWDKLKSWCRHSLTVAWSYVQIAAAAALVFLDQGLDALGALIGDPALLEPIRATLPPQWLGWLVAATGAITFAVRLRSLMKAA